MSPDGNVPSGAGILVSMDDYGAKKGTRKKTTVTARVLQPSELAPKAARYGYTPALGDLKDRCRWCRRPNGAEVIAWASGHYCLWVEGPGGADRGYFAFFDRDGVPLTEPAAIDGVMRSQDMKAVTVSLGSDGLCKRCRYDGRARDVRVREQIIAHQPRTERYAR